MDLKLPNQPASTHASQAAKFITCGLLGAAMEFSILKILIGHFHLTPFIAYLPSALIPVIFVFFFNKYVTFKAVGQTTAQTKRFILVYVIAFCVNYALSSSLYSFGNQIFLGQTIVGFLLTSPRIAYLAKAMAIGITAVFNYCFSHYFIFRKDPIAAMQADMAAF